MEDKIELGVSVVDSVWSSIWNGQPEFSAVEYRTRDSIMSSVDFSVWRSVQHSVGIPIRDLLGISVWTPLWGVVVREKNEK